MVAANPYLNTTKFNKAREMGIEIVDESFIKTGKAAQIFNENDAIPDDEDEDKKVTFEFLDNGNIWAPYDESAHGIVEAAFQDWVKDPSIDVRPVKSGQWIYRVDFNNWNQTNMQVAPHTVRDIRRCIGGVAQPNVPPSPVLRKKKAMAKKSNEDEDDEEDEKKPEVPKPKAKASKKKGELKKEKPTRKLPKRSRSPSLKKKEADADLKLEMKLKNQRAKKKSK